MADSQSGETIRSMISGFNTMQAQLGLLPQQSGAQPMGVSMPPPPPPPQMPHPSEIAMMAMQQQQQAMQQTVQAAQMTRYTPPPSSPPMGGGGMQVSGGGGGGGGGGPDFTWGRSMNQMASQQLNPFVANAFSGGAGVGMPNPMMMTSPQFGGYRPRPEMTNPFLNPGRIPDPMNPFAVQPPSAEFAPKYLQDYRMMQGQQASLAGFGAAKMQAGFGLGGALLGGLGGLAMGGPLGAIAGGWLGGKMGNAIGNFALGPAVADEQRGRQIQNMTAPYMVGGANLNAFTGQGMERSAARETARQLRTMTRDHDFERQTGFNTQDVMKITQLASDQGLLQTSRSPEDISRKVKDISKAVKTLVNITGDPDVRKAIASLGQMRELGFEGLAAQTGAVANRAAFARMAGVSQAAMMQQYGAPGAMMAQQIGMAGATGFNAGMMGGASANMAVSAGAFNDLQLSRAGGKAGVAQTNMMASLAAANQDLYMAAALKRDAKGKLDVDVEAYKRAQGMSVGDVARMAQDNIAKVGQQGIYELSTRKQEFKDILAQRMGPMGMQMNVIKQAQGLMKEVPGMTMGAALRVKIGASEAGQGMSAEQQESAARTLELQFQSRDYWDTQIQQLRVQKRHAADRERARREQYRTPGLVTRMGYGVSDFVSGISEGISGSLNRNIFDPLARAGEDRAAYGRGERIDRYRSSDIIRNETERGWAEAAMNDKRISGLMRQQGADPFAQGVGGRGLNIVGQTLGLSAYSEANKLVDIASRSQGTAFGWHPFSAVGSVESAKARITDVNDVARGMQAATGLNVTKHVDTMAKLRESGRAVTGDKFNASAVLGSTYTKLRGKADNNKAGWVTSATALGGSAIKQSFIEAAMSDGRMTKDQAEKVYESNKESINMEVMRQARNSGDKKFQEVLAKSEDTFAAYGSVSGYRGRAAVEADAKERLTKMGLEYMSDEGMNKMKTLLKDVDKETLALVAAEGARQVEGSQSEREAAAKHAASIEEGSLRDMKAKYLRKGMSESDAQKAAEKEFETRKFEAAQIYGAQDVEGRRNLRRLGSRSTGEDIQANLESLKMAAGERMGVAAEKAYITKLSGATGRDLTGASLYESLSKLTGEETGLDKETAALVKEMKTGKIGAEEVERRARKISTSKGPKGRSEISGGGVGEETRNIDQQIEEIESLRDQVAAEKPKDKLAQLQAESSVAIATAAKHLDDVADKISVIVAGPGYQSGAGGG